jgi:S-formylglutathione hydrolase FrmB
VGWTIAYPPGPVRRLPVAVVLHGWGADHTSAFSSDYLGLGRFLAAAVAQGAAPFALASVDGGDTYWHARSDGGDSGAMVTDEFLPLLATYDLDVGRIGFLGWSMGGYGALRLAGLLGTAQVAAVGTMSAALWESYDRTAPGAFDSVADFAAHTVFGRQASLEGVAVRVDCGTDDPFIGADRDYVSGFASPPDGVFEPGSHDLGYWRRMAPAQVRFLAGALG